MDMRPEIKDALKSIKNGLQGYEVFVEDVEGGHIKMTAKKGAVTRIWLSNGKQFEALQLPLFEDEQDGA